MSGQLLETLTLSQTKIRDFPYSIPGSSRSKEKNDSKSTQFLTMAPENKNLTLSLTQTVTTVPNTGTKELIKLYPLALVC